LVDLLMTTDLVTSIDVLMTADLQIQSGDSS